MIQRIQSVYLFAAAACGLLMLLFPIAEILGPDGTLIYKASGIVQVDSEGGAVHQAATWPVLILGLLTTLMAAATIFLFKNRPLQIRLCKLNFFLVTLLLAAGIFYIDTARSLIPADAEVTTSYGVALLFPVGMLVLTFLAQRGVVNDEKLIRSQDRLR